MLLFLMHVLLNCPCLFHSHQSTAAGEVGWEEEYYALYPEKLPSEARQRLQQILPPLPLPHPSALASPSSSSSSSSVSVSPHPSSDSTSSSPSPSPSTSVQSLSSRDVSVRRFIADTKRTLASSFFLQQNVQLFGEQGGFHAILQRIARATETQRNMAEGENADTPSDANTPTNTSKVQSVATPSLSVPQLVDLLRPLYEMRGFLPASSKSDFLPSYSLAIRAATVAFLLSIEDEETLKTVSRRTLDRPLIMIDQLLTLCTNVMDALELRRWREIFDCDWAWHILRHRSLPLDRRINAANDIKDYTEIVERKEDYLKKKSSAGGMMSSAGASVLNYVNPTSSGQQQDSPPAFTKFALTSHMMCRWILERSILNELLDPASHIELIRRSFPVMRLLTITNKPTQTANGASSNSSGKPELAGDSDVVCYLCRRHLDLLWRFASTGHHESIAHLVYDIVARLAPTLPVPLIQHIFQRMCEKPFNDYDNMFLTLVYNFTLHALQSDTMAASGKAEQSYGLELLWSLLQSTHTRDTRPQIQAYTTTSPSAGMSAADPTSQGSASASASPPPSSSSSASVPGVSSELLSKARSLLLDLLSLDQCAPHRMRYLERCVMNVKSGVLIGQTLPILLQILHLYPRKAGSWFGSSSASTQSSVIETLNAKYDLLQLVINELQAFQRVAAKNVQIHERNGVGAGSSPSSAAHARHQHLAELESREEFLITLLQRSPILLTRANIDLLWDCLILTHTTHAARDSACAWMIDACDSDDIMTQDAKVHLFQRMLELEPHDFTPLTFNMWMRYFLHVHAHAGTIKLDAASSNHATDEETSEFSRILAKHRSRHHTSAPSLPLDGSTRPSSPHHRQLSPHPAHHRNYDELSDEDQLSSDSTDASSLSQTAERYATLTVHRFHDLQASLDQLWSIAMQNPRAHVARQTILLLNALHINLAKKKQMSLPTVRSTRNNNNSGDSGTNQTPLTTATPAESHARIRDHYLTTCLSRLGNALRHTGKAESVHGQASSSSKDGAEQRAEEMHRRREVSRCIFLLKTFLYAPSKRGQAAPLSSASTTGPTSLIIAPSDVPPGCLLFHCFPSREYRAPAFDISISNSATIGDLRTRIYQRLVSLSPNTTRHTMLLVWQEKKLVTNIIELRNVGFRFGDAIQIRRHTDLFTSYQPSSIVYTSANASIWRTMLFDALQQPWHEMAGRERCEVDTIQHRAVRLSAEECERCWSRKDSGSDSPAVSMDPTSFDRLFELLSPPSSISESVFDILMLLPPHTTMLIRLTDANNFNVDGWEALLDIRLPYRLLYSLQLLELILRMQLQRSSSTRASFSGGSRSSVTSLSRALGVDMAKFDLAHWATRFIQQGGVNYLIHNILLNKQWHQSWTGERMEMDVTNSNHQRRSASSLPRSLYFELLHSLYSLLHLLFCLDPAYPGSRLFSLSPSTQLQAGIWCKQQQWPTIIQQIVKDGIMHTLINTHENRHWGTESHDEKKADEGSAQEVEIGAAMDPNRSVMLISALRLLAGCIHSIPALLPSLILNDAGVLERLVRPLLLQCPSLAVRTQTAQVFLSLFKLSLRQPSIKLEQQQLWLTVPMHLLSSYRLLHEYADQSSEYFLFLISALDLVHQPSVRAEHGSLLNSLTRLRLVSMLFDVLRRHPSTERHDQPLNCDAVLVGTLQVLRCCILHRMGTKEEIEDEAERKQGDDDQTSVAATSVSSVSSWLELLRYIYDFCLFRLPLHPSDPHAKCQSHRSRVLAFGILLELSAADRSCYSALLHLLSHSPMWHRRRWLGEWNYDPTLMEKSAPDVPVGLKNMGSTCYINSFMQVLFAAKEFRDAVLSSNVDDKDQDAGGDLVATLRASNSTPSNIPPYSTLPPPPASSPQSSSLITELQRLFAHLRFTSKSYYDPLPFCSSLKDYSGAPVNLAEQKDVNEFAALLFEQIEEECKLRALPRTQHGADNPTAASSSSASPSSSSASLLSALDSTFKGSLIHEIVSLDPTVCPHTTAREESFSMLSLTVVNKHNLQASLAGFVEGDRLEGENKFFCGQCKSKVAAVKRCCLHDTNLPTYLILHLARFEFDFDRLVKVKVNDWFEFPYRESEYLSVEPYTRSGRARAEAKARGETPAAETPVEEGFYDYELVAVLIHGGSAEGGHYISLCKADMPAPSGSFSSSSSSSSPSPLFYEFNDTAVRGVDASAIPRLCFGGVEQVETYDRETNKTTLKDISNIKNAYMCIYKRRWKPHNTQPVEHQEQQQSQHRHTTDHKRTDEDEIKGEKETESAGPVSSNSSISGALSSSLPSRSDDVPSAHSSLIVPPIFPSPSPHPSSSPSSSSSFPPSVSNLVWRSNIDFQEDKWMFDASMAWFLWNLTQVEPNGARCDSSSKDEGDDTATGSRGRITNWCRENRLELTQLCTFYVFNVLVRSNDNATFCHWMDLLYQLFSVDATARAWLLDALSLSSPAHDVADAGKAENENEPTVTARLPGRLMLRELLLDCPIQVVREAFCDMIVMVMSVEREAMGERERYFKRRTAGSKQLEADEISTLADECEENDATTKHAADDNSAPPSTARVVPAPHALSPTSDVQPDSHSKAADPRALAPAHRSSSPIIRFMSHLLSLIPLMRQYGRQYREYWRLMYEFARFGADERRWLLDEGALRLLIADFYLYAQPCAGFNITHSFGGAEPPRRKHPPNTFWMMQLLALLIRSCTTDALPQRGPSPSQAQAILFPLPTSDRTLIVSGWLPVPPSSPSTLHWQQLIPWLLSDRTNSRALLEIVSHWCWEHADAAVRLFDLLHSHLINELNCHADLADYRSLFHIWSGVLILPDSIQSQRARAHYALQYMLTTMQRLTQRQRVGDARLLLAAIQHILQAASRSQIVAEWLDTQQDMHANLIALFKRGLAEASRQAATTQASYGR